MYDDERVIRECLVLLNKIKYDNKMLRCKDVIKLLDATGKGDIKHWQDAMKKRDRKIGACDMCIKALLTLVD